MANYSIGQLKGALAAAGFNGPALDVMAAISLAENTGRDLMATNTVGNSAGTDRGPFQINSYYHPDVPDSCAFDLTCSAQQAYKISGGGSNFGAWSTYKSGAYLSHLADVTSAPVGDALAPTATLTNLGPIPTPSDAVNSVVGAVRTSLLTAVFFAGGLGLVVAGLWRSTSPVRSKVKAQQDQAAQQAGPALAAMA